jgi:FMN-dependent NADH-azoreductase
MAVFAGEEPRSAAWDQAVATFRRFDAAELYLFSVPMWNAGVPYKLKQFIDVISQPGLIFGFDPEQGYSGLLRGKRAAIIYTSAVYGPERGPSFGRDFQAPYLDDWLRWAGLTDISDIHFRPDLAVADAETPRRLAHAQARDLAKRFA